MIDAGRTNRSDAADAPARRRGHRPEVRSANLVDLAPSLPREADRTDMRYQWIARVLSNTLIDPDAVMAPFAAEVLERAAAEPDGIVLILNPSKLSERHQMLMLAVSHGERAVPLVWRVEATAGAIGFATQKDRLDGVAPWIPAGAALRLMGDRFYGAADLIALCQTRGWDYRLRLKGTLTGRDNSGRSTTAARAKSKDLLSRRRRADGATGQDQHRHHQRSGSQSSLDHRDVGQAGRSNDAGVFRTLGDRANVLRLQVAQLWHRRYAASLS